MIHVRSLAAALAVFGLCAITALTCKRSAGALDPQTSAPSASAPIPIAPSPPLPGAGVAVLSANAPIEDERNTISVFRETAASAVFVTHNRRIRMTPWSDAVEVPAGSGSGFVWDAEGHIVTNYHVVMAAVAQRSAGESLTVTLQDQSTLKADVRGFDQRKDIAVLKVETAAGKLVPIRLHDPKNFRLQVGQKAIAIGNPFGLDHTLTVGIVSALGRSVNGVGGVTIRDMIQTDAAINPGNSGGPLLDSGGRLIGMNTAIFSQTGASSGVGFAVPSSTIQRVVPQIIRTGRAEQIGIGIEVFPQHGMRRPVRGVVVLNVRPDSPAERVGLKGIQQTEHGPVLGDVIVGVDQHQIDDYDDLYNTLDGYQAGQRVKLKVKRGNELLEIPIELVNLQ